MKTTTYKIFEVSRIQDDFIEFWKAASKDDLLAWIHDSYGLNWVGMLGLEVREVSLDEAEKSTISYEHCDRYEDTRLVELFADADDGCCLLASTN